MSSDQTTEHTTAPRTIAGRYTLLAEIGRGGMGVVWRGEDTVIGREVAIKELRPADGAADDVFTERVLREVRAGGRLNDPAVVTVYDVVADSGAAFIVMELIAAPTLSDLVRSRGPLPAAQVASIGRQVLSALEAAHRAGIVHRDVKPGNIMITPNGRAKLTDFGIAQAVDDPRLTLSGTIIGSPAFMAPERVAGRRAEPASDLWALGATLFFASEGVMAFERPTTAATLHAIVNDVPYPTRAQGPLASAITGLLIPDPDARLVEAQAHELFGMAEAGAGTGPMGIRPYAEPVTAVQHAPRTSGKRRALATVGALCGVLLLVGAVALGRWWGAPKADEAMRPTLSYGPDGDVPSLGMGYENCTNRPLTGEGLVKDNYVDCKDLHYLEFYDKSDIFDSSEATVAAPYPDPGLLKSWAEAYCATSFHTRTSHAGDTATLDYQALIPGKQAWEHALTSSNEPVRQIRCVLGKRDGSSFTGARAMPLK
ncbi:serine/threonine-protein kinase [Amycolatopsis pigmentata]|uniref:non-specific serine/threonine protein kinase n=1 Tax=Amycolatopsis pigmentata TaxID=450801 RepID=A0ABW5G909_9PSEU